MRHIFYWISFSVFAAILGTGAFWPPAYWLLVVAVPVFALGIRDGLQSRRAVLRNFPVIGHFRYLLEKIRPEINQYFIESNTDGKPFSRELRSVVYQRAKSTLETLPFGTQRDVYEVGYEWLNHSVTARPAPAVEPRIKVGGDDCVRPYEASVLNVSAMSYGALSKNAILALNGGARLGGFYQNTGEGGISPYHLEAGGDLAWQIGTAYFACRDSHGRFSPEAFAEKARIDQVKLIEIKLSQGAKPGHGGILPGSKVTPEIADIRGIPVGVDAISPPSHTAFDSPRTLLLFVQRLRELSGGKPIGIKMCVGHRSEFLGICKAAVVTGICPDFIVVDGAEGGTGAAPLEFANSIGSPLTDGLVFVHNALVGFGLREQVRIIASGRVITGFHMAQRIAAGADMCGSARGFMFALGCIQALRCNSNDCPVGVATQNTRLVRGLDVTNKTQRVANFHRGTVRAFLETLGAAGLRDSTELRPWHIYRRVSPQETRTYAEIYEYLRSGALLDGEVSEAWMRPFALSSPDSFRPEYYDGVTPVGGVEVATPAAPLVSV